MWIESDAFANDASTTIIISEASVAKSAHKMGARCDGVGVELDTHGRLCGSAQSTDRELREKDTNQKITQVRSCLLVT